MDEQLINAITQIGIIPATMIYTLVVIKKSVDNNTIIVTKLYERMGGKIDNE